MTGNMRTQTIVSRARKTPLQKKIHSSKEGSFATLWESIDLELSVINLDMFVVSENRSNVSQGGGGRWILQVALILIGIT